MLLLYLSPISLAGLFPNTSSGDSIDFRYTLLFYTVRHGRYRYKSIVIGVQR
jgi:hypothetical protein